MLLRSPAITNREEVKSKRVSISTNEKASVSASTNFHAPLFPHYYQARGRLRKLVFSASNKSHAP